MMEQLMTFSTNTPRCHMTFATLSLRFFTFSSISFEILLIPGLLMNRRMNHLAYRDQTFGLFKKILILSKKPFAERFRLAPRLAY